MPKRALLLLSLLLLLSAGCRCGAETPISNTGSDSLQMSSRSFFAMDTYMTIRANGVDEALLDEAAAWVGDLEASISVTREDSAIHIINQTGSGHLPDDAAALLRGALALCEETGGALDITVYPIVRAWGFTTGEYRVPDPDELQRLLHFVDHRRVQIGEDGEVKLPSGVQIDLGSIAKGYTGDRLCALLRGAGIESAMLDLGGNIQVIGGRQDGSDWRVGIQDPEMTGLLGVLRVRDRSVITSGGYERYFEDQDGNLWWHIMDPTTGMPVRSGLLSVTVVGEEGLICDALSTALFVMGEERAAEFWRGHEEFEMILVTEDGRVLLTEDLVPLFTPSADLRYRVEEINRA